MPSARIFVVDDHPLIRRGFHVLIGLEPGLTLCGEATGASDAFRQITALRPDLAIIDLSLKEGSGLELIRRLRAATPEIKLLVFSMHSESTYVHEAHLAGADAFVSKTEGTEKVIGAIRKLVDHRKQQKPPASEA